MIQSGVFAFAKSLRRNGKGGEHNNRVPDGAEIGTEEKMDILFNEFRIPKSYKRKESITLWNYAREKR